MGLEHEQNCCLFVQMASTNSADHGSSSIDPADVYLAQQGRKQNLILGDGNCFFRAVLCVVHGTQDNHPVVCENLVSFVEANKHVFEKFVMKGTFEHHVSTMCCSKLLSGRDLIIACCSWMETGTHQLDQYCWNQCLHCL